LIVKPFNLVFQAYNFICGCLDDIPIFLLHASVLKEAVTEIADPIKGLKVSFAQNPSTFRALEADGLSTSSAVVLPVLELIEVTQTHVAVVGHLTLNRCFNKGVREGLWVKRN
jgi:hypothetical protein